MKALFKRFRVTSGLLGVIAMLGILAAALYMLRKLAHEIDLSQLGEAITNTPLSNFGKAALATLVSYGAMIGYDYCGTRYAGLKLKVSEIVPVSFCAFGLGNTLGFGWLSSGAVRYRLYSAFGVPPEAIAKIIAFIVFGFGVGVSAVGGFGLLFEAGQAAPLLHLPARLLAILALIFLGGLGTFLWWAGSGSEVRLGKMSFRLPTPILLAWQFPISIIDIVAAGTTLWYLLPDSHVTFATFICFYALAVSLGIISHVPGGLGVFESAMLFLLQGRADTADLLAALVAYRVMYYLLPFLIAVIWLAIQETRSLQKAIANNAVLAGWRRAAPAIMSGLTFLLGVVLLASGVIPAGTRQLTALDTYLPLALQEGAHFTASLFGLGLIILAQGLRWRSNVAWLLTTTIFALNVPLALAKGLAVTEAAIFGFAFLALLASRPAFYRAAGLLSVPFNAGWWLAVLVSLGSMVWLLFFAYQHVEYSQDMWWQFASFTEASRSLRATLGVMVALAAWGLIVLLRPAPRVLQPASRGELLRAGSIVRGQAHTDANLAALGDKYFLFSTTGRSFVMYAAQGRSWIALYDPVGPVEEAQELIWRFRELADGAGARPSFYEASADYLPMYVDAGFSVLRLGEQAFVELSTFDLEKTSLRSVRQTYRRAGRDGLTLEFVDAATAAPFVPELRRISNAWLAQHRAREKGFSLGRFEDSYVGSQALALVKQGETIVAFATLLLTDKKDEVSVDLMRHVPDAPRNTMDFLFVSIMLEFQRRGYHLFNLGMAPLSGLAENPLASLWHRLGRRFYLYGERFYNFRGLRAYKDKYDPVWRPRYLATLSGSNPYLVLADVTKLISGGWRGAIGK